MKAFKKIGSIVLAICLCFSLCNVSALAASSDDTQGSITIEDAIANETYTIYQIFELTYTSDENGDNTGESYSYKVNDSWVDYLESYYITGEDGNRLYLFTITENYYLDPGSAIFNYNNNDDVISQLARDLLEYAVEENIEGTSVSYTATVDEDGNVTAVQLNPDDGTASIVVGTPYTENGYVYADLKFNNLDLGYYLVDTSLGSLCMLTSTDPDAEIYEKNSTPVISKHIYNADGQVTDNNDHEEHEYNGTAVTYELDVEHVTGAVNLVIHDSQPSELHEDWTDFHPTVTLVDGNNRTELKEDDDYTIILTGTGEVDEETGESLDTEECSDPDFDEAYGCTFEIDFSDYDFTNVSDSAYIEVIYDAILETEGDIYADDFDEIDNWAVVTFGLSSSSPVVYAEVYSFGFEVFKYTDSYGTDVDIIFENVYYDFNAGDDAYIISCDDEDGYRWYAVFDNNVCDENGWQNASFTITEWVSDENNATHISEPTDITNVGDESSIYTWEFYYAGTMSAEAQVHVREIETNGDEGITVLDEIDEAIVTFGTGGPLAGAVFEVSNTSGQTAYFLEEDVEVIETDENDNVTSTYIKHIYLFEGWFDDASDVPDNCVTFVTSSEDGMIYIEGLDTGTYIVTEIAAPDGYNMLDDSITVVIWAEYDEETGAITDHGVEWVVGNDELPEENTDMGVVNVLNNSGAILPSTGGMGTTIFYVIGAVLVCGAAVLLITRRRMSRAA